MTASSDETHLGYPPSPPHPTHLGTPIADSPRSSSTGGRLRKVNLNQNRPMPTSIPQNIISPRQRKPVPEYDEQGLEETEMVTVTYEEGLKRLGLDKPHHILHSDPPAFDESSDIHIQSTTPPFSTQSSRPTPTTANILTPDRHGHGHGQGQYGESPLKNTHHPRSVITPEPRGNVGRSDEGRFPTDSELMWVGIPSYYHDSSTGRYKLESPGSTP
jgi:hypothetical protein